MNAKLALRVMEHLKGRRTEMVDFLQRLVALESPSSLPEAQAPVFELLSQALLDLGFSSRLVPGAGSGGYLYARPRQRYRLRPLQLLLGHCDTVWPLGTLHTMPLQLGADTMRGPGVFDMKGGLTQMIFALEALRTLGLDPPLQPLVLINSDEEIGSSDSTPVIRRLARLVCRTFVLEPALGPTGKLKTARKGVGRFSVIASAVDEGSSDLTILELASVIQRLFALNELQSGVTVNVGTIDGGLRSGRSRAQVDVRVPNAVLAGQVEAAIHGLQSTTPGVVLEIDGQVGRPPLERTPRNRALWQQASDLGRLLGLELEEGMAGGGSDGNTTSQVTATLDGLGAVGDGAHAVHEFIYLERLLERCALLVLLLLAPARTAGQGEL